MTSKERLKKLSNIRNRMTNLNMEIVRADPWIPIIIGTQEYHLEYSLKAALDIFRETGFNVNLDEITLDKVANLNVLPKLLLYGLDSTTDGEDHGFRTEDDILNALNPRYMVYYTSCIMKALTAIQPDEEAMQELIEQLRETIKEEDTTRPLAEMPTSSDSGDGVEILDAPI